MMKRRILQLLAVAGAVLLFLGPVSAAMSERDYISALGSSYDQVSFIALEYYESSDGYINETINETDYISILDSIWQELGTQYRWMSDNTTPPATCMAMHSTYLSAITSFALATGRTIMGVADDNITALDSVYALLEEARAGMRSVGDAMANFVYSPIDDEPAETSSPYSFALYAGIVLAAVALCTVAWMVHDKRRRAKLDSEPKNVKKKRTNKKRGR